MADSNIKEALESVVGYIGEEVNTKLETKQDVFKVSEMDEATSSNVGNIVQYIGASIPDSYQHNYFYECKAQETEPETYAWEQVNVQPSSEGDARVKPEITEVGVDEETGTKVHIVTDVPISDINEVSLAELKDIVDAYYADEISLADIKDSFKLGQTIRIDMPALAAATGGETHVAQPIFMRLVSYDTKPLTTAINGHTKALFTFDMSNTLLENGGWSLYTYSGVNMTAAWASNTRRTWCNDTFYNALPDDIKALLKTVNHSSTHFYSSDRGYSVTQDKIVILSEWEYTGGSSYETEKQCDYYKTVANRIKTKDGVATSYATDTIVYMGTDSWTYSNRQINASGNAVNGSGNGTAYPLSMAFFM